MTWHIVTTDGQRDAYLANLQACADYAGNDTVAIFDKIAASCEIWLYQGEFSISLALRKMPGREKVVTGVPSQNADPEQVCRVMISKIREVFDALGVEIYFATLKESYTCDTMAEFTEYMGRVCHEFRPVAGSTTRVAFDGTIRDKTKDLLFVGPRANEPLAEKWKVRKAEREAHQTGGQI